VSVELIYHIYDVGGQTMFGAIAGDIIGSVYEGSGRKTKQFPLFCNDSRFTDDTVLTVAVAEQLLTGADLIGLFHDYFQRYPLAGYGGSFIRWAGYRHREPYNSWGNGSAMRVSPIGIAFDTLDDVLVHAKASAEVTHSHHEGIRGAQATAAAIFLARTGHTKVQIKEYIEQRFRYDLSPRLDDIRDSYRFDVSCQGSVPQSIIAFLEADDFEDAVRNAISLGGDADTMACIAGAIAEPFFGIPETIKEETLKRLDEPLREIVQRFAERFQNKGC
jgi:ADP-ribosylglycohydrolase